MNDVLCHDWQINKQLNIHRMKKCDTHCTRNPVAIYMFVLSVGKFALQGEFVLKIKDETHSQKNRAITR